MNGSRRALPLLALAGLAQACSCGSAIQPRLIAAAPRACCLELSPDARSVAYLQGFTGSPTAGRLMVVPAAGGAPASIADGALYGSVRFAADGQRIAYRTGNGSQYGVAFAGAGTTELRIDKLCVDYGAPLSTSADFSMTAAVTSCGTNGLGFLYLSKNGGSLLIDTQVAALFPPTALLADGKTLYFGKGALPSGKYELWKAVAPSYTPVQLNTEVRELELSPDGARYALAIGNGGGAAATLFVVNTADDNPVPLSVDWQGFPTARFTPRETGLIVAGIHGGDAAEGVYFQPLSAGSAPARIANGTWIFSGKMEVDPDDSRVVFIAAPKGAGAGDLVAAFTDGSGATKIAANVSAFLLSAQGPIAYLADVDQTTGLGTLFLFSASGSQQLGDKVTPGAFQLSKDGRFLAFNRWVAPRSPGEASLVELARPSPISLTPGGRGVIGGPVASTFSDDASWVFYFAQPVDHPFRTFALYGRPLPGAESQLLMPGAIDFTLSRDSATMAVAVTDARDQGYDDGIYLLELPQPKK